MANSRFGPVDIVLLLLFDIAVMGVGVLLGWLLDKVVESAPLLELFGLMLGIGVAGVVTWARVRTPAGTHGR
jgi:F0F1-type ATP synthase assembly protein I